MSVKKTPAPRRGSKLLLSVGLVNVPVKIAPFVVDRGLRATSICPTHQCKTTTGPKLCEHGHVVEDAEMAFEWEGRFVTGVDRADHRAARDGTLALTGAVDLAELDPAVYEKTYLVWPQDGGEAGYDLLARVLEATGSALIGTTTVSTSTKALAIRWSPLTKTLLAHVLAYDAAIAWDDVKLVHDASEARPQADAAQVKLAEQLLQSLPGEFELSDVEDVYQASLRAAVAAAAEGSVVVEPVDEAPTAPVGDLMAALQASVAAAAPAKKTRKRKEAA